MMKMTKDQEDFYNIILSDDVEDAKRFLETHKGFNLNYIHPEYKDTVLHSVKSRDMVHLLADHKVDLNALNSEGKTALYTSVCFGHYEPAKALIERGADVNAKTPNGKTPLHIAHGSAMTKLLLDNGADPEIKDNNGNKPDLSHFNQFTQTVDSLRERGSQKVEEKTNSFWGTIVNGAVGLISAPFELIETSVRWCGKVFTGQWSDAFSRKAATSAMGSLTGSVALVTPGAAVLPSMVLGNRVVKGVDTACELVENHLANREKTDETNNNTPNASGKLAAASKKNITRETDDNQLAQTGHVKGASGTQHA